MLRQSILFALLFIPLAAMHAQEPALQSRIRISADRVHDGADTFFDVHAEAFVRATPQQAWGVLTDYESLADFVPDLLMSRVVARNGGRVLVEQRSRAGFLFVSHDVHMVLRIDERPPARIDVALESGDMKRYGAHWELTPSSENGVDGTRIRFAADIEPEFFVPPLVGDAIVEGNVRDMVRSVVGEIERRAAH